MWCSKCNTHHIVPCSENHFSLGSRISYEPIVPKFEPIKFEPIELKQPELYYCGEIGCPGHSGGGACPRRPGPGMGLGPPGNPMTW
jgi:hypothetical protein